MDRPACATCTHYLPIDGAYVPCGLCLAYPISVYDNDGVMVAVLKNGDDPRDSCELHPDFPAFIESRKASVATAPPSPTTTPRE